MDSTPLEISNNSDEEEYVERVRMVHRVSAADIDVDFLNTSLANVNTFAKRKTGAHNQTVLMFEIRAGQSQSKYLRMNLRELLQYINREAVAPLAQQSQSQHQNQGQIPTQSQPQTSVQVQRKSINRGNDEDHGAYFQSNIELSEHAEPPSSQKAPILPVERTVTGEKIYYATNLIRIRDLRRLDFQFNPIDEPNVIVRRNVVLLSFDDIRALVMHDRLILIVPDGADSLMQILEQHMQDWANGSSDMIRSNSSNYLLQHFDGMNSSHSNHNNTSQDINSNSAYNTPFATTTSNCNHSTNNNNNNLNLNTNNNGINGNAMYVPFEIHAYEALLTTVNVIMTQEYNVIAGEVSEILEHCKLASILPIEKQEKMRILKNTVTSLVTKLSTYKEVLSQLMENDDTMSLMNLTLLFNDQKLYRMPLSQHLLNAHEDIEEFLESSLMDFNSVLSKCETLRTQLISAEDLIMLRLDTSRNELLIANTSLSVLACCIGFSAYITGIFGMNLDNTMEIQQTRGVFYTVIAVTLVMIVTLYFSTIHYYNRAGVLPVKTKFVGNKKFV